jgi:hypothetical protein
VGVSDVSGLLAQRMSRSTKQGRQRLALELGGCGDVGMKNEWWVVRWNKQRAVALSCGEVWKKETGYGLIRFRVV